jgi:hypothetical protein
MTKHHFLSTAAIIAAVLASIFLQSASNAVPSFARRAGGVSCDMCHWHQNALNATGKEFLRHGVRFADEQANAGDEDFKLSHYASLLLTPGLSAVEGDGTRFSAGDAALWVGGPLDGKFSALAEIEFQIDDVEVEVEEIYAHYVSDPGSNYFSGRIGQFQPLALLAQVSGAARTTISRPEAISGRATNGNGFRPRSRLRGVEFGTVRGPLSAYLGLGNGPQQNAADNHMDIYATVEHEFGDQGSSIGAWAYWGEAVLGGGERDSFNRYGILGNYTAEKFRVLGGVLVGSNDDALGAELNNQGGFLEVDYALKPGTVLYGRWDKFDRDVSGGGETSTDGPTLGFSWLPTAFTRIAVEGQWLDTNGTSTNSATAEVQIVF